MKYRTIFLFGAPGAGKGTQGRILGAIPGFFYCACGDVFRNLRVENPLGREFIKYASRGLLVPDEPTVALWRQSVDNATRSGQFHPDRDILILDGIPRNLNQARILKDSLDVLSILYLRCNDINKMIERLQRRALRENRLDDAKLSIIRQRLKTYERETAPVLKFYGRKLVHVVDSEQTPQKVLHEVLGHITKV